MKKLLISFAAIAAISVAAPAVAKPGQGQGGGAQKAAKHQNKQRTERLDRDPRFDRAIGQQGMRASCPPGLAKKNNGCLPPGQAKKFAVGSRLPSYLSRYNVPVQYQDRYYDNGDYSYRYDDQNIYRVNRGTGLIDQIISVLGL
jgi:Ni/Co efflux regulator RcnB